MVEYAFSPPVLEQQQTVCYVLFTLACVFWWKVKTLDNEPVHEISNNVVCATSKASDQPAHTRSLIRAFASLLSIL